MRRAFKIISLAFPTMGQLSAPAWTKRKEDLTSPTSKACLTLSPDRLLWACSAQRKLNPPFCIIALNRSEAQGGASSCPWFPLTQATHPRFFQLPWDLISCFLFRHPYHLVCCETCHTPGWNRKAHCPRHLICQSNGTVYTKRKGQWDKTSGTQAGSDISLRPCPVAHKASNSRPVQKWTWHQATPGL